MEHSTATFISETLSRVRQLQSRGARDATGLHYVEGFRAFIQLVEAGIPINRIVYSEVLAQNPLVQKQVRLSRRACVPVARVTPEQFRRVSSTERASGIGVIARQHWTPIGNIDPRRGLCWLAVSLIRSPGNLGTLVRTAEAVGAGALSSLAVARTPSMPTSSEQAWAGCSTSNWLERPSPHLPPGLVATHARSSNIAFRSHSLHRGPRGATAGHPLR